MLIAARDPETGSLLRVSVEGAVITAVERTDDPAEVPWLAPGLVDLQVNGFAGFDVNAAVPSWEKIAGITAALGVLGVTTWCPTVITAAPEQILERLTAVREARRRDPATARAVPGVHVEGPFLSDAEGARGVHDPAQIRAADLTEVERWLPLVRMVTLSPHCAANLAAITHLARKNVVVAIGHTDATPEQVRAAADAGASVSTHLGNGAPQQLPRHPNLLWTQLADDRLTAGLIADGHHLAFDVLEVMLRAKTADRAFLVSDSTELAGHQPGQYRTAVGGRVELSPDGRLSFGTTGLLAGAALPVTAGLRNVVAHTSFSLAAAVRMVTRTPARLLLGVEAGELRIGAPADLVLLDDAGAVLKVMTAGRWLGN